jgi:hypothetical protein
MEWGILHSVLKVFAGLSNLKNFTVIYRRYSASFPCVIETADMWLSSNIAAKYKHYLKRFQSVNRG